MDTPVAPPSTTTPTVVLGKYKLDRLLGRGGFTKVYQGSSTNDETHLVAIKIVDKSKLDPSMALQIVSEISSMRRLNHPNIIRIDEVLATKSKIYLVMELAPGGDLHDKIFNRPNRRLPEPVACRYFHQIVDALHFCHVHGVAHRDIKPENVLLDANGLVKVSDFGLSAIANDKGDLRFKTPCGTPVYAAPEVMTGQKGGEYDGAKADAWSVGVLLYTMLVGKLPFDYRNLPMMYRKAYRRDFGFPSHVSRPARGMVYKLLDPNPKTRVSIEEITKNEWFRSTRFGPRSVSLGDLVSMDENRIERVSSMNAFDIIGMNSGLDFSGLFDDGIGKKERRFTSKVGADEVVERVVEVGGKLGYEVEKGKGGKMWLGRDKLVLVVEVLEMGSELLVEIRVVQGGGCGPCGGGGGGVCGGHGGGIGESHWEEIKDGLGDVVDAWLVKS